MDLLQCLAFLIARGEIQQPTRVSNGGVRKWILLVTMALAVRSIILEITPCALVNDCTSSHFFNNALKRKRDSLSLISWKGRVAAAGAERGGARSEGDFKIAIVVADEGDQDSGPFCSVIFDFRKDDVLQILECFE